METNVYIELSFVKLLLVFLNIGKSEKVETTS
jgi:hypothetical protein